MKKGQAAMEFLMTYGWAILVVIAAIAALAYFGVLDPARLLPERCQSAPGMDCLGTAQITTQSVAFVLKNNRGFPVTIQDIRNYTTSCSTEEASEGTNPSSYTTLPANVSVGNNREMTIRLTGCTGLAQGDRFEDTFNVYYVDGQTGFLQYAPVDLRGRVQ